MIKNFLTIYLLVFSTILFAQNQKKGLGVFNLNQNIKLIAELEKENLVIGEQVLLNIIIYTKVAIEEVEFVKEIEHIGNQGLRIEHNRKFNAEPAIKTLEGEQYVSKVLTQYLVYPWKEGKFELKSPIYRIARHKSNSSELIYDSLKIESPFFINIIPSEDKKSSYKAKNGVAITCKYSDSLIHKGIVIADLELCGRGDPFFYSPPDFGLGTDATVHVQFLKDDIKMINGAHYSSRSYRYTISFHEKGDYKLSASWNNFDTQNQEWKIYYSEIHHVQIKNTRYLKTSNTNILPLAAPAHSVEDIVFVIDLSTSMLAKDFVPNRLEAVKTLLIGMIKQKETQQKIGLVVFAGEAMVLCPMTMDSNKLLKSVEAIKIDKLENGTAITSGLLFGLYELSKSNTPKRHLFLLTDGVQNIGVYSPQIAAQIANKKKIQIHSFGIGCNGQAMTPVARKSNGEYIYNETDVIIDEKILRLVGKQTGGIYSRITCNSDLNSISSLRKLIDNAKPNQYKTAQISDNLIEVIWRNVELKNAKNQLKYWKLK